MKTRNISLAVVSLAMMLAGCSFVQQPAVPTARPAPATETAVPTRAAAAAATVPANAPVAKATTPPQPAATLPAPAAPVTATAPAAQPTPITPLPTARPAQPAGGCVYKATYVADVSVPDGTTYPPNAQFTKTWRVKNDGTCAWGPGSEVKGLISVDGERMSNISTVDFPIAIEPGQTIEVSIPMVAPAKAGTFKSEWLFAATNGSSFGVGRTGDLPLSAQIAVKEGAVAPGEPQPGATPAAAVTPAAPAPDAGCTVRMAYVSDVTVLDGAKIAAGSKFVKTWRVRNAGTCAWGPGTPVDALAFVGGEKMTTADIAPLEAVAPGATTDISVELTAPETPGTYRSEWKLRARGRDLVGLGADGRVAIYALINATR